MSDQNIPPQPPPQGGPYGYPYSAPYGAPQYGAPQYGTPPYPPGPGYPPSPYQVPGPHPSMLASQGVRLGAKLLDGLLLMIVMMLVTGVALGGQAAAGEDSPVGITVAVIFFVLAFVIMLGYEPFMIWKYGATVGKQLCKIRVARLQDGQGLTLGQAMGRFFVVLPMNFVPFLGFLNALWCCWDEPHRQCLHDKVVSSVVVKSQA